MNNVLTKPTMTTEKPVFVKKEFTATSEYYINVRKDEPNSDAPVCAVLEPGRKVNILGYVSNGEKIRGSARWYKTNEGHYIWGGFIDGVQNL